MGEKAIWLDIALLCCIFTRLRLVKIQPHTRAISSHIAFSPIKYIYLFLLTLCTLVSTQWKFQTSGFKHFTMVLCS